MTKEEMSSKLVEINEFVESNIGFANIVYYANVNKDLLIHAFVGREIHDFPLEEVNKTIKAAFYNGYATSLRELHDILVCEDEVLDDEDAENPQE